MKEKRKVVLMVVVLFFGLCVTPSIIGIEKADSIFNSNILLEEYYTLNTTIIPNTPSPEDGAIDVDADADLSWEGGHPTLIPNYRIYFSTMEWTGESPAANQIGGCPGGFAGGPEYRDTTWDLDTLAYETTYYWQIYSQVGGCSWLPPQDPIWGPVWSFTTAGQPTIVSVEPAIKIVERGETFDLYIHIEPVEPFCFAGIEFIYFDETLLQVNAVEFQSFFDPHPTNNDYTIDNLNGEIRYIYEYTAKADTVQTAGNFLKITFTADATNLGTTAIELVNVDLLQPGAVPIPVVVLGEMMVTIAIFCDLIINISGCGEVELFPIPPCPHGTVIDLLAIPCSGWDFDHWQGDVADPSNPITTITMGGNKNITVVFVEAPLPVTLTIEAIGPGSTYPQGTHLYSYNTIVEVEAFPNILLNGKAFFLYWLGDIPGGQEKDNPVEITMDDDKTITANFWSYIIQPMDTCGRVDVVGYYDYTLTAIPFPGWMFSHWAGDICGTQNPITVILNPGAKIIAVFITTPPEITNVAMITSEPLDTDAPYGWENVTCTVTSVLAVNQVKLVVTNNTATVEHLMINIPNTETYYFNTTITQCGVYYCHIWANDTSENNATSDPEPFELPLNWDVSMDGRIYIEDFVLIAGHYGEAGPEGWIREDVSNNGRAYLEDFVLVAGHYGE